MASRSSAESISPASLSFVAFTSTMTRIVSLLCSTEAAWPRCYDEQPAAESTARCDFLRKWVGGSGTWSPAASLARSAATAVSRVTVATEMNRGDA
ncbi:hypothetical protein GCM10011504_36770 [Siccirubricoccus deserti]|nr:hypothetical protein GCM10011504_36770 [Siccirubricoccus deserti]